MRKFKKLEETELSHHSTDSPLSTALMGADANGVEMGNRQTPLAQPPPTETTVISIKPSLSEEKDISRRKGSLPDGTEFEAPSLQGDENDSLMDIERRRRKSSSEQKDGLSLSASFSTPLVVDWNVGRASSMGDLRNAEKFNPRKGSISSIINNAKAVEIPSSDYSAPDVQSVMVDEKLREYKGGAPQGMSLSIPDFPGESTNWSNAFGKKNRVSASKDLSKEEALKQASKLLSPEPQNGTALFASLEGNPVPTVGSVQLQWQQQWIDYQDPHRITPFALRFKDPLCEHLFERHRYEATKDLLMYFLLVLAISSCMNAISFDSVVVQVFSGFTILLYSACGSFLFFCRSTHQEVLSFKWSSWICRGFFLWVTISSQMGMTAFLLKGSACSDGLGNWVLMSFVLPFLIAVTLQPDFRFVLVIVIANAFYSWSVESMYAHNGTTEWCLHTRFDLTLYNLLAIPVYYIRERSMRNQFVSQKVFELRLEDAKKEAQSANRAKRNFLSYIFHEIRVPLNAIAIGIDLLLDDQKSKGKEEAPLDSEESLPLLLKQQVENASHILDDVLSLQKIEEGRFEIEQEPFNIVHMLQTVAWTYSRICMEKQIDLKLQIDECLKQNRVIGDQFRLRQVVANFISNALKFTPVGGDIKISAQITKKDTKEPMLEVSVRDTGIGISEPDQKCLFQPYVQISAGELQKGRGTGLGLNISKHIIRLHEGKIGVKSVVNVGSKFFFQIPYKTMPILFSSLDASSSHAAAPLSAQAQAPAPSAQTNENPVPSKQPEEKKNRDDRYFLSKQTRLLLQEAASGSQSSTPDHAQHANHVNQEALAQAANAIKKVTEEFDPEPKSDRPKRCLIVEDSATNSKLLGRMVTKWNNWETSFASNGKEAVILFEQMADGKEDPSFDLVIMDKEMPVMHGDEAIRLIRAMGFTTPIIALTGNAFETERIKLEEAGADAFLSKPTSIEKLRATVATVFERKGLVFE